ncbi:helix-turn-helix domain-containing protein [Saccharothrix algeriensis]|uniref:Putative regulatory protein n=1 Tax=Saccharothrix algeriensis TaxID=173560 RepID=A0A0R5XYG2_9PSEU|nr:XRE family transcriptional regulator [Saccharothrix algeriensis]AJI44182.1 putative regulatory protein [Saccharothrix algeriensis]MBM7815132.1 transcriptional regulator with XRE-family HTH domain [Saccharothrix algeriensis]QTR03380.1 helix-turn-helix domain-containing protein [Saccharothrix algeriensis]
MREFEDISGALSDIGPRLRRLRTQRRLSLSALSEMTGISKSTLSRLEAGQRRPSLELLLPVVRAYRIPLDELIGGPEVADPRIRPTPRRVDGSVVLPLTRQPGPQHTFKTMIPPSRNIPELCTHEGYEWLYVLSGRLRLVVAEQDLVLEAGEAAEFDTRLPHWFGSTGECPVEVLNILGPQGERIHLRVRTNEEK